MKIPTVPVLVAAWMSLHLTGCSSPGQRSAGPQERSVEQAARALERNSDADSLAAAAMLRAGQRQPAKALELLARATMIAPERPDLAWLHIQACDRVPACTSEAEVKRLGILDPANGAAWLPALAAAEKADDQAMRLATLAALARADYIDLYWTTLIIHLTRPVIATGRLSSQQALTEMIGVVTVETIPVYRTVSQLCAGTRLADSDTLQDCRSVAAAFEHGDTVSAEMLGASMAQRLWPGDSSEWLAANEAHRVYEYRAAQQAQSAHNGFADSRAADEFLALCAHSHREQDVVIAEFVADGKNPVPPPE